MKVSDIIDEIYLLVKDNSFFESEGEEALLRRINLAVASACSHPGIEVPSLKKLGMVTTEPGEAYAPVDGIADNFAGRILRVGEPGKIKVYGALEDLYADYYPLAEEGEVEAVCIAGNVVWYQKIPALPTDLICVLQDDPPLVESVDDYIPVIPEPFQMRIVVHGVAAHLYDNIEDGVDGAKVNTDNSKRELAIGIQKWMEFLGQRRQHNKTSHWRY